MERAKAAPATKTAIVERSQADGQMTDKLVTSTRCGPYIFGKLPNIFRGGAAYLYLISILIWPHFDTYPYISIQNILMSTQNILITKIYL